MLALHFAFDRPVLAATGAPGMTAQEVRNADAGLTIAAGEPVTILEGAQMLALAAEKPAVSDDKAKVT